MSLPSLPGELWDKIIDNVDSIDDWDQVSMKACSLVRKDFLPRARAHIFHNITLSYYVESQKFLEIIEASPHLGAYIIKLTLSEGRNRKDYERLWLSEALPRIACRLTAVQFLELNYLHWDGLSSSARSSLLDGFQQVTSISFGHCKKSNRLNFQELVASFPNLKDLHDPPTSFTGPSNSNLTYYPPKDLQSVQSSDWEQLAPWLLHGHSSLPIQKFGMCYLTERKLPFVQSLLSSFGHSLKTLQIDFNRWDDNIDACFKLDSPKIFSSLSSLQTLIIDNLIIYSQYSNPAYLMWLIPFLSQIISKSLKHIKFRFWMNSPEELDCTDWSALDNLLLKEEWKDSLERITFQIWGEIPARPAEAKAIRDRLPKARSRGLLEFDLGVEAGTDSE